jgi:hypothetical protein
MKLFCLKEKEMEVDTMVSEASQALKNKYKGWICWVMFVIPSTVEYRS